MATYAHCLTFALKCSTAQKLPADQTLYLPGGKEKKIRCWLSPHPSEHIASGRSAQPQKYRNIYIFCHFNFSVICFLLFQFYGISLSHSSFSVLSSMHFYLWNFMPCSFSDYVFDLIRSITHKTADGMYLAVCNVGSQTCECGTTSAVTHTQQKGMALWVSLQQVQCINTPSKHKERACAGIKTTNYTCNCLYL